MDNTHSIKIFQILQRYFNNDTDGRNVVAEIGSVIDNKFLETKNTFTSRSEVQLLRKDMEHMEARITSRIENSILGVESNLKSEINKLIVWIIATMFGAGALFITIAKVFFDK